MTDDPGSEQPTPTPGPSVPERQQSYAEKYAGTPWGRPTPSAAPPPPPPSRAPLAFALVAVVAIVVAGVGLVALALSPGQAGGLKPSSTFHDTSTLAPGIATPAPPTPADPGVAVKDKFWALVSDPNASYHMTASGRSTVDGKLFESFKQSIDVVGDEYSGWIDSNVSPKGKIARKDGVVWVKVPGKARVGRQTSERYYRLTPFLYLGLEAWIDYVKPVTVGGRHLHLLRTNSFYRPDIARMLDLGKFPVVPDKMNLDVLVTDAGVPVSAVFTADVTVGNATQQRFHGKTTFAFSKFGDKLRISVPKR